MPEHVIFLAGKKVNLRPYNKATDLGLCQRWINDPEVRQYLKNVWPYTLAQEEEFLEKTTSAKTDIFLIMEIADGKPIGIMHLTNINWIDRTAATGSLIGEKEYWGRGYGTDGKMLLLHHAFFMLNLRKVTSIVLSFNKRSLAYNAKCGYRVEGVRKKQRFRNGIYYDEIQIAVFKKYFRKLWKKYRQSP